MCCLAVIGGHWVIAKRGDIILFYMMHIVLIHIYQSKKGQLCPISWTMYMEHGSYTYIDFK